MMPIVRAPARLAPVALLTVLAMPRAVEAQDYKPSALNVAPNEKLTIGRQFRVKMATPPRGIDVGCDIGQDGVGDAQYLGANDKYECTIPGLEHPTSAFKPGPARLVLRAYSGHTRMVGETVVPIQLVAAVPRGGAGKAFDSGYWSNYGGNTGSLRLKEVVVKNGILGFRLYIGDNISFTPVTGIIIDQDGTVVRQAVALGAWTAKPGEEISDEERDEANGLKTLTVSGQFLTETHGRGVDLNIEGPLLPGWTTPIEYSSRLYRNADEGEHFVYSGGGSSRSSASGGSGGGGGACKKACFHDEATCSGSRGACLKARQQCVKACR